MTQIYKRLKKHNHVLKILQNEIICMNGFDMIFSKNVFRDNNEIGL